MPQTSRRFTLSDETVCVIPPPGYISVAWRKTECMGDKLPKPFVKEGERVQGHRIGDWFYCPNNNRFLPAQYVCTVCAGIYSRLSPTLSIRHTLDVGTDHHHSKVGWDQRNSLWRSFGVNGVSEIPTAEISCLLYRWVKNSSVGEPVVLIARIYIQRACEHGGLRIYTYNLYNVLSTALLLAEICTIDYPYVMSHYAKIAEVDVKELNKMVRAFLVLLDFRVEVDMGQYAKHFQQDTSDLVALIKMGFNELKEVLESTDPVYLKVLCKIMGVPRKDNELRVDTDVCIKWILNKLFPPLSR